MKLIENLLTANAIALIIVFIINVQLISAAEHDTSIEDITSNEENLLLKEMILRLKEQNSILIETGKELRATYYWALGFMAVFLITFLGVNIYFTRDKYKEE